MRIVPALVLVLALAACNTLRSAKLLAPTWFGFTEVKERVYIDEGASEERQRAVFAAVDAARQRVADFFGEATAEPRIFACVTDACFARMGGSTARGKTYGESHILVSPQGIDVVILAHELTHAELHHRLGGIDAWRRVPAWFDEGLAVLVSADPRYSDAEWLYMTNNGQSAPPLATLGNSTPWNCDNWQLAYGTARRAVGEWYVQAGKQGLARLIERVRSGESFDAAIRSH